MLKKIIVSILMLGLVGCASVGNRTILHETREDVDQKITTGVTTKEDVRSMYGDPIKSSFNSAGDLEWTYSIAKQKKAGMDALKCLLTIGIFCSQHADSKNLVILFDNKGIVKNYDLATSEVTASPF